MKIINLILLATFSFSTAIAQFGSPQIVSENLFAFNGLPHDVDNDGFIDIVSDMGVQVVWFKNQNGLGEFGTEIIISQIPGIHITDFVDLDNDGDKDLLYSRPFHYIIGWLENMDGAGNFGSEQIILEDPTEEFANLTTEDIDNDGDIDIIVRYASEDYGKLTSLENLDGQGNFGQEILIFEDNFSDLLDPLLVDINNDGNLDILTAGQIFSGPAKVIWFEGFGDGTFGNEIEIFQYLSVASDWTSIHYMKYTDINTDGLIDIVISTNNDDTGDYVFWLEAIDGQGNYEDPQILINTYTYPYDIHDLDNDGDGDFLSYYALSVDEIFWWKNTNGTGPFGTRQIITDEFDNPRSARAADFNGDGRMDAVATFGENSTIAWFENTGILDVSEKNETNFSVHPNPTSGEVLISSEVDIATITLFDNLGRKIKSVQNGKSVSLIGLQSGIYFIKITTLEDASETLKVVKL
ncbi:MAG: hypothetical protein ACI9HJ_001818 [Ulvibacter sp.]|jgi:hypothetical protein